MLILTIVHNFGLIPAATIQDNPSFQQVCSVWKNGISWCNKDGVISYVELTDNEKSFVLKVCCQVLKAKCLTIRSKIIPLILQAVKDFCPSINTIELVIDQQQVINYPLQPRSELTLCTISNTALAIISNKEGVISEYKGELPLKQLLNFEPFAGLDQNTLQCILSEKNIMKDEIISDGFISHFTKQIMSPEDSSMYITILNQCHHAPCAQAFSSRQELIQALRTWRDKTDGTYNCLRETLNNYSIFSGRNLLVRIKSSKNVLYYAMPFSCCSICYKRT